MLCPVLCRQSQRIKQLTLVDKTKGLGNLYVTRCNQTHIICVCMYTWNGLFQWSYVWVLKKKIMILIKEKLRMMLRLYIIKICYARILMCKFAFLFPPKRGMKYPPPIINGMPVWRLRRAIPRGSLRCLSQWKIEQYNCSPGIVLSMRFIISLFCISGKFPFLHQWRKKERLKAWSY